MDKILDLLINQGLYSSDTISSADLHLFEKYFTDNPKVKFRLYCPKCKETSVFELVDCKCHNTRKTLMMGLPFETHRDAIYETSTSEEKIQKYLQRSYTFLATCPIDDFQIIFNLLVTDSSIIKVGQYPSIADLEKPELNKYKKILGDDYSNLNRAIGLFACGVGIGSFVYLRRIIERLVNKQYNDHKSDISITEEDFSKQRFVEKIKSLSKYLPKFLVENSNLYGIVSKGVHELEENECLEYFRVIEKSIEAILNQELEAIEKEEVNKQLSSALSDISASIKK